MRWREGEWEGEREGGRVSNGGKGRKCGKEGIKCERGGESESRRCEKMCWGEEQGGERRRMDEK